MFDKEHQKTDSKEKEIMKIMPFVYALIFLFVLIVSTSAQSNSSVWAVDFVKTKDGQQANYLKFIEQNWAKARVFMKEKGIANSYQVLSVSQKQNADWDVLLMTEYKNQTAYERREAVFKEFVEYRIKLPTAQTS